MLALLLAIFIPVIAIVLTMVSILPALGAPPLPSFEDPTKVSHFKVTSSSACNLVPRKRRDHGNKVVRSEHY